MKARSALLKLFKESREWRDFFRSCCETSAFRLRSQERQFRKELEERGNEILADEVEDALLGLARELMPNAPAAQWDPEWADRLCKDALARLATAYAGLSAEEQSAVDLSTQGAFDERICAAGRNNDPAAFRAALRCWEREGLEAMQSARVRGGAA
jgi:hypothetical protein